MRKQKSVVPETVELMRSSKVCGGTDLTVNRRHDRNWREGSGRGWCGDLEREGKWVRGEREMGERGGFAR